MPRVFAVPDPCRVQEYFDLAGPADVAANPFLARFAALAAELRVVLPISFYERAGRAFYNSIAIMDADGACLGVYRKSHIPTGPGYQGGCAAGRRPARYYYCVCACRRRPLAGVGACALLCVRCPRVLRSVHMPRPCARPAQHSCLAWCVLNPRL